MGKLDRATYKAKYDLLFANNTTREISEADLRSFVEDTKDSFLNIDDSLANASETENSTVTDKYVSPSTLLPLVLKLVTKEHKGYYNASGGGVPTDSLELGDSIIIDAPGTITGLTPFEDVEQGDRLLFIGDGVGVNQASDFVVIKADAGGGTGGFPIKTNATTDPGVTNDINDSENASDGIGFRVGSKWKNTTSGEWFICDDNTDGASVWSLLTLTKDNLGSLAVLNEVEVGQLSTALLNLINGKQDRISGTTTITHTIDGADLVLDYTDRHWITLKMDHNIGALSFTGLVENLPVILEGEMNDTTPYTIASITNLWNNEVMPYYPSEVGKKWAWKITLISTKVLIEPLGTVNNP